MFDLEYKAFSIDHHFCFSLSLFLPFPYVSELKYRKRCLSEKEYKDIGDGDQGFYWTINLYLTRQTVYNTARNKEPRDSQIRALKILFI